MQLYKKMLGYILPFWKHILLSLLFTFCYVLLNNISLWVSVDFVGELFPSKNENRSVSANENTADSTAIIIGDSLSTAVTVDTLAVSGKADSGPARIPKSLGKITKNVSIYKKMKLFIKDVLVQDNQRDTLLVVCLVIFISFLFKNLFDYLRKIINRYIQLSTVVLLRNRMHMSMLRLPLSYFHDRHSGELTSIMLNDGKVVQETLNNTFGKLVLTPIQLTANVIILFLISWKLSLVTLLIVPVSGILIVKIGQSMRRKSKRVFKQISVVASYFQEAVAGIRIVKAFTAEDREINKYKDANKRFFQIQYRAMRLGQATSPVNEVLGVLILVALLWYGGNLVYLGEFNAEDFMRFLIFLFAMFQPLNEFSGLNNLIQRGMAAAERIFSVIDAEREVYDWQGARELKSFSESIKYEHVTFQYPTSEKPVLKNINITIPKGKTVAFVGHSGSGKSTLVNLLPRFYHTQQGCITIDGTDHREFNLTSLRKHIGIVTQDIFLFNGTIRENIAYGIEDATQDQIIEAAQTANAWEFIQATDKGLDSMVGEMGVKLSGGQKQRLSIARAMLKNAPILILDEATSSLDTESEKLVQQAIDGLMKNRTVLVIAHRLSTIIHADQIVVMNQGTVEGMGNHKELLKTCALYRKLYEMQFNDDNMVSA